MDLLDRPFRAWTVAHAASLMRDRRRDPDATAELAACPLLARGWRARLTATQRLCSDVKRAAASDCQRVWERAVTAGLGTGSRLFCWAAEQGPLSGVYEGHRTESQAQDYVALHMTAGDQVRTLKPPDGGVLLLVRPRAGRARQGCVSAQACSGWAATGA